MDWSGVRGNIGRWATGRRGGGGGGGGGEGMGRVRYLPALYNVGPSYSIARGRAWERG